MPAPAQRKAPETPAAWLERPEVGTGLTIASGLSFLLLCMILPLVGKAGVKTLHYTQNWMAFALVLILTLVLSGLAVKSKMGRRRSDQSPLPYFSLSIFGVCGLLAAALVLGLLKI